MDRTIRYHPLFDCDVMQAASWYDGRSMGLGDAFATNVRIATDSIIAESGRFGRTSIGVRYARVKRFSYIVLSTIGLGISAVVAAIDGLVHWLVSELRSIRGQDADG